MQGKPISVDPYYGMDCELVTIKSGFRVTVMLLRGSCSVSWLPQNNTIVNNCKITKSTQ